MKRFFILLAVVISFVSCTTSGTKVVTPSSTQFPSGKLSEYFQICDQSAELSIEESPINGQYLGTLSVTLKQIKNGKNKNSVTRVNFNQENAVLVIDLIDKEGTVLANMCMNSIFNNTISDALLKGSAGDTFDVLFTGEFYDKKVIKKLLRLGEQFTPSQTSEIKPIGKTLITDWLQSSVSWYKDKLCVTIMDDGNVKLTETYHYRGSSPGDSTIKGTWYSSDILRGNDFVKYYQIDIVGYYGTILNYYIPGTLDYVYKSFNDLVGANEKGGYKVVKVQDVNLDL